MKGKSIFNNVVVLPACLLTAKLCCKLRLYLNMSLLWPRVTKVNELRPSANDIWVGVGTLD